MPITKRLAVAIAVCLAAVTNVSAGPYSDTLSKCLVDSSSAADRATLIRWMFAAGAANPAIEDIASVSPEQLELSNVNMAKLTMRLITELCREQTEQAIRYEGVIALQIAFKTLGEVAGQELFASPEVASALAGFESHLDNGKLQALVNSAQKPRDGE